MQAVSCSLSTWTIDQEWLTRDAQGLLLSKLHKLLPAICMSDMLIGKRITRQANTSKHTQNQVLLRMNRTGRTSRDKTNSRQSSCIPGMLFLVDNASTRARHFKVPVCGPQVIPQLKRTVLHVIFNNNRETYWPNPCRSNVEIKWVQMTGLACCFRA